MKQDTPYLHLSEAEHSRELACMKEVLSDAAPPALVYEAFGGVGMVASLMCGLWPEAQVRSWELDPECVKAYRARNLSRAKVTRGDTRYAVFSADFDAASLDFNQFTIMDLTRLSGKFQYDIIASVVRRKPKWFELTDSAVSHLHLNWAKYGLTGPVWDEYVKALSAAMAQHFGYCVVRQSHHRRASYFRLEPA